MPKDNTKTPVDEAPAHNPTQPAMKWWRGPLVPYMVLSASLSMGYGSVFTLLAEFRERFGFSETELGMISASGFFAGFAAQIGLSRYADRGFTRQLIWAGIFSATLGMVLLTFATAYWQFVGARVLFGLGTGAVGPALRRLIISRDPDNMGENLGRLVSVEIAGFVLGPAMAALVAEFAGIRGPFVVLAVLYALLALPLMRLDLSTTGTSKERFPVRGLLAQPQIMVGLLMAVALYTTIGMFEAIWAVLLDDLGAGTVLIGVSLSLFTVPMILLAPTGGRLAAKHGALRVTKWTIPGAMIAMLVYAWSGNLWVVLLASLFHAFADSFSFPGAQVHVAQSAPTEQIAAAQGLFSSTGTLTSGLVAAAAGVLYDRSGPELLFTSGVSVMAFALVAALLIDRRAHAAVSLDA